MGDTENIMFKIFADSWYIWKIGCSHIKMDKLTTNQENYSSGEVFSPNTLIKRIKQISGDGSLISKIKPRECPLIKFKGYSFFFFIDKIH